MWWNELEAQSRALSALESYVHPSAEVAASATLLGKVHVEAGARICHGAFIQGPVWIGRNCVIGNMTMIRGPITFGDGCRVGFATEIKNAIIGDDVAIGPQCFIADSKIETQAYLGAQVRTSNHRLDRETVKVLVDGGMVDTGHEKLGAHIGARASIGIQVIILPGRVVAPDTMLGPRITVEKNLPAGRYLLTQELCSN